MLSRLINKKFSFFAKAVLIGTLVVLVGTATIGIIRDAAKPEPVNAAGKAGLRRSNGYIFYYYKNGSKAKNKAITVSGTRYYFSSKGRGFIALGNGNANKAMAKIINKVKFTSKMSKKDKFRKCFRIIKNYSYGVYPEAPKAKKEWYKLANKTVDRKSAKCYGYAAISAVCAKALGYKNVRIRVGKVYRPDKGKRFLHAWTTVGKRIVDGSFENSHKYWTGKNTLQFFMKTKAQIKKNKVYSNFNGRIRYVKITRTCKIS